MHTYLKNFEKKKNIFLVKRVQLYNFSGDYFYLLILYFIPKQRLRKNQILLNVYRKVPSEIVKHDFSNQEGFYVFFKSFTNKG